jgi:hypothetical protein
VQLILNAIGDVGSVKATTVSSESESPDDHVRSRQNVSHLVLNRCFPSSLFLARNTCTGIGSDRFSLMTVNIFSCNFYLLEL